MEHAADQDDGPAIAVIGMAGRFPGAQSVSQFWDNIWSGTESIRDFSDEELLQAGVSPSVLQDPRYVKRGALLDGWELFDAEFFGITPREAELTDPQQRLFLELAWEALEHAGYDPMGGRSAVGVFGACSGSAYFLQRILRTGQALEFGDAMQLNIGNEKDFLCSRVAYQLNLRGPAVTVQTACSSSLVAVHMACQSLLAGECTTALAGGVSVTQFSKQGYVHSEGGIASPDGRCRAFDALAGGTVTGNGAGIVVLKELARALADGDTIHAVIRGSAINNDGSDKVGFTAPSVKGQAAAITEALAIAGLSAEDISYVEAHGTGTKLGDPIEIQGLRQAYSRSTKKGQFCAIGSVKTNIGHLDAAAGVAGLIKTVLSLQNRRIPASLHFSRANPLINFADSPFFVNAAPTDWKADRGPRRAGVSSFGIGGTNAHVIVEEAPAVGEPASGRASQLILLSARTANGLAVTAADLREALSGGPAPHLADVAYTRAVGRHVFEWRHAVVCDSVAEAVAKLGTDEIARCTAAPRRVAQHLAFVFPGQGTQYVNMARELYESEAVFRREVDQCCAPLQPSLGLDLRALLFPAAERVQDAADRLVQTQWAQPALFVVEYALACLLKHWGIVPSAMAGHSVGEYVAACLAGVFTLPDALNLIALRGKLMSSLPAGAMLAVYASEAELLALLQGSTWIAAVNSPGMCTASGEFDDVERLKARLAERGLRFQELHTSHAFHSGMMDPIVRDFEAEVAKVALRPPTIPFASNVTGAWITPQEATSPAYWAAHLRQPVRFAQCLGTVAQGKATMLLEVGPGRVLSDLARHQLASDVCVATAATLPNAKAGKSALTTLLDAVGTLWTHGISPDWPRFYEGQKRRRIPLPTYPFERKRFAVEGPASTAAPLPRRELQHGKRENLRDWFYEPVWKRSPMPRVQTGPAASPDEVHLVLVDRFGLCASVVKRLAQRCGTLIVVKQGEGFSSDGQQGFTIDPADADSYVRLLSELVGSQRVPTKLTHFWSLTPSDDVAATSAFDGFYSLLFLAQAFAKLQLQTPMAMTVVSNGLYRVFGHEALVPDKATILGPAQVLPIEVPNLTCRVIDLDDASAPGEALTGTLASEIETPGSDAAVAYRGAFRWTRVFEPVSQPASMQPPSIRDSGHFLVVGGLGGIGFSFASYLAQRAAKPFLTIVGRTELPERAHWNTYLASRSEEDSVAGKIRQLQSLERLGASVLYICADVAVQGDVQRIAQIASAFAGGVHGVFHAAGLADTEGVFERKSAQTVERFMAPKLLGTRWLDEAFGSQGLDFFLLCSSVSAIAPAVGHIEYCAVNAFLDAYAHQRNANGANNVVAINWSTWQGVGMAVKDSAALSAQERQQRELYHSLGISAQDAPALFDVLLQAGAPQVVVTPVEFGAMLKGTEALNAFLRRGHDAGAVGASAGARPALATAFAVPRNDLERVLAQMWQSFFGMAPLGIDDDFFELGGHSLLATQIISRVRSEFDIDLPLQALFDAPTIGGLARVVQGERDKAAALRKAREKEIRKNLDAMSPDELKAMLLEQRRLKATSSRAADHG